MKKSKESGQLITFEGGEGAGKTTIVALLQDKLTKLGKEVIVLREPGGTVISEQIREVVLSAKNTKMAYTTEVLLFQAARAQIYSEIVIPSLKAGKVVVMDRSRDSSVVYQGMVRGFGRDMIEQLNNISTDNTLPDLTILLDVPEKIGLKRREEDGKMDRLDLEAQNFHTQVREAYLTLAQEDSEKPAEKQRWQIVDATQDIDAVATAVWHLVSSQIK